MPKTLLMTNRQTGEQRRVPAPTKYLPRVNTPKAQRTIRDEPQGLNPLWVEAKKRGLI